MEQLVWKLPEVETAVGLKRTAIYDKIKRGEFPEPIRLSAQRVAWRVNDIREWLDDCPTVTVN